MSHKDEDMLALVALAQDGDREAQRTVALYCFDKYKPRVRRLVLAQTRHIIDQDDAEAIFFEGIMVAVLHLDERGDPLYHAGQRGVWALMSAIRSAYAIAEKQAARWKGWTEEDPIGVVEDVHGADAYERVDDRLAAEQRVQVLTTAPLKPHQRRLVEAIVSGVAGDPRDDGFNKRLATAIGISPQRASQIRQELRRVAS